ncbi:MFS transporter [Priestia taiwanensis]|uniref:Tetracycline resistance MFS efflux pump n=1 Tax=Priestia taiwanensis TaxID=1347902 RepID=A0A917EMK8_9BACI|nr:MFS transporter [Priestia taiwanensis]MBM7361843.1 multidrug resistance protein [Priestia taiwanensis]GGE57362.1 tetracycline resistance MFS efflux pump [Priestia taiwanensis]
MEKPTVSPKMKKAVLLVVAIAIFTDMLIYGLVVPILPLYATSLGASQTEIGILFASYAITLFLATPILGALSDKVGRKNPMFWGLIGLAASTVLFAFAESFWLLVLARALQGIAAAATWTAGLALLADVYPKEERGKAMGIALSGQAAGMLLGPTMGGWLYELGGYHLPFIIAAAIALLDGLLRLILLRDLPEAVKESTTSPFALLKNRELLMIACVVLIGAAVPSILEPTLPLFLEETLHLSPGMIGLLFAVPTIAYGVMAPIIGSMSTKIGAAKTIAIGLIATAITFPLVALSTNLVTQLLALALLGASMGTVLTPCLSHLTFITDKLQINAYGVTFAIYNIAYSIGMMVGPLTGSILVQQFNFTWGYTIIGAVVIVFTLFFMRQKTE